MCVETVSAFLEGTTQIYNQHDSPTDDSLAKKELSSPVYGLYVPDAYTAGGLLIESVAEYIGTIVKALSVPCEMISASLLFRGVIETSSLGIWLLDKRIKEKERTARSLSYRINSLEESMKTLRNEGDNKLIEGINGRLADVKSQAISLGYTTNKKGIVGQEIIFTNLVNQAFQKESLLDYRFFSMMIHGNVSLLIPLMYQEKNSGQEIFDGVSGSFIEKNINPVAFFYICNKSIFCFTRLVLCKFDLFGWDKAEYKRLAENTSTKIKELFVSYRELITTN